MTFWRGLTNFGHWGWHGWSVHALFRLHVSFLAPLLWVECAWRTGLHHESFPSLCARKPSLVLENLVKMNSLIVTSSCNKWQGEKHSDSLENDISVYLIRSTDTIAQIKLLHSMLALKFESVAAAKHLFFGSHFCLFHTEAIWIKKDIFSKCLKHEIKFEGEIFSSSNSFVWSCLWCWSLSFRSLFNLVPSCCSSLFILLVVSDRKWPVDMTSLHQDSALLKQLLGQSFDVIWLTGSVWMVTNFCILSRKAFLLAMTMIFLVQHEMWFSLQTQDQQKHSFSEGNGKSTTEKIRDKKCCKMDHSSAIPDNDLRQISEKSLWPQNFVDS